MTEQPIRTEPDNIIEPEPIPTEPMQEMATSEQAELTSMREGITIKLCSRHYTAATLLDCCLNAREIVLGLKTKHRGKEYIT